MTYASSRKKKPPRARAGLSVRRQPAPILPSAADLRWMQEAEARLERYHGTAEAAHPMGNIPRAHNLPPGLSLEAEAPLEPTTNRKQRE